MKKVALILLTGMIALSALEWKETLLTDEPTHFFLQPLLLLDNQGYARVIYLDIYYDWYEETSQAKIKTASNQSGHWVTKEVATLSEYFLDYYEIDLMQAPCYGFDVDSEGRLYVAFVDFDDDTVQQLHLATEQDSGFTIDTLTSKNTWNWVPVVQLDEDEEVQLAYIETDQDMENAKLYYGWVDNGAFSSQKISDNVSICGYYDILTTIDLVLASANDPHVFYTGSDDVFYHASRTSATHWESETVADVGIYPSAIVHDSIGLCVSYSGGEEYDALYYATYSEEAWIIDEVENSQDLAAFVGSSLAFNPQGYPYIAWLNDSDEGGDILYTVRSDDGWIVNQVGDTPYEYELPGMGHFFAIDNEGYGHMVYSIYSDYVETTQIFYARSYGPLPVGIVENPARISPMDIEIFGSEIFLNLPQASFVQLSLYDASGRLIEHLASGNYTQGRHQIYVDSRNLAAGAYFIRAQAAGESQTGKFVVIH